MAPKQWYFVIHGAPVSQKNDKRIYCGQIVSSDKVQKWRHSAIAQLQQQFKGRNPIPKTAHISAKIISYCTNRQFSKMDLDNLYCAPQDAMQAAGILENDWCIVNHDGSARRKDNDDPRVEITLTRIDDGDT